MPKRDVEQERPPVTRRRTGRAERGWDQDQGDDQDLSALQERVGNRATADLVADAGSPVPVEVRQEMERSFGRSFGDVRLHAGGEVDDAAERLDAAAFTLGTDVYLHEAVPDLGDPIGRDVLGEELAHVVQGVGRDGAGRITDPGEPLEAEAHAAGEAAGRGERAAVTGGIASGSAAVARDLLSNMGDVIEKAKQAAEEALKKKEEEAAAKAAQEKADQEKAAQEKVAQDAAATLEAERQGIQQDFEDSGDEMPPEDAERLKSTATPKLEAGIAALAPGMDKASLVRVNSVVRPMVDFIGSFSGVAGRSSGHVASAAANVMAGCNALDIVINPTSAAYKVTTMISGTLGKIGQLIKAAKAPGVDADGNPMEPTTLTPEQAGQLSAGMVTPLKLAQSAMYAKPPDVALARAHLLGIINAMPSAPTDQIETQLMVVGVDVRLIEDLLLAMDSDQDEVMEQVKGHWRAAVDVLAQIDVSYSLLAMSGTDVIAGPPTEPPPK